MLAVVVPVASHDSPGGTTRLKYPRYARPQSVRPLQRGRSPLAVAYILTCPHCRLLLNQLGPETLVRLDSLSVLFAVEQSDAFQCRVPVPGVSGWVAWGRARQVITKVAADQLVFTPLGITLFYATITSLEGRPEDTPQALPPPSLFQHATLGNTCPRPSAAPVRPADWAAAAGAAGGPETRAARGVAFRTDDFHSSHTQIAKSHIAVLGHH